MVTGSSVNVGAEVTIQPMVKHGEATILYMIQIRGSNRGRSVTGACVAGNNHSLILPVPSRIGH